jgi:DNA primase
MAVAAITKDDLRDRLDILDVIGGYVRLQRAGSEHRGLCPFHEEKTPSFYVNGQKGVWICRGGCGVGGDVFDFVMRAERLEFREAAELLANKLGLTLAGGERDQRRSDERDRVLTTNGLATQLFERALWNAEGGRLARDYLATRGLTEDTIRRFRLGYAPDGWDHLANHLRRRNHSLEDAELAGLVRRREQSSGYYDRFRHRIMFPILDSQDRTLGFGGRVLRKEDEPKYLNTPETAAFSKRHVLYGLPFAVGHLETGAIVVEGYMDVIALHQAGVPQAMATLGTALTDGHLKLLRRHTERVILCYDADNAGRRATDRAAVLFIEQGIDGRVLTVTAGKDPDEFIAAQGREAFLDLVAQAPDLVEYRLREALAQAGDDPAERSSAVQAAVVPILRDIGDEVRRAQTVRRVVEWWAGDAVGLQEEFERALLRAVRAPQHGSRRRSVDTPPPDLLGRETRVERWTLGLLLRHPRLVASGASELGPDLFGDAVCRGVYLAITTSGTTEPGALSDSLDERGRSLVADLLCQEGEEEAAAAETYQRLVAEMRVNALQRQVEALRRQRAALPPEDFDANAELVKRIGVLEQQLHQARHDVAR